MDILPLKEGQLVELKKGQFVEQVQWKTSKYRILNRLRQGPATSRELGELTNARGGDRARWQSVSNNVAALREIGHVIKRKTKLGGHSVYTLVHDAQKDDARSYWASAAQLPTGYPVVKERRHFSAPPEDQLHAQDGEPRVVRRALKDTPESKVLRLLLEFPGGATTDDVRRIAGDKVHNTIYGLRRAGHEIETDYDGGRYASRYRLVRLNAADRRLAAVRDWVERKKASAQGEAAEQEPHKLHWTQDPARREDALASIRRAQKARLENKARAKEEQVPEWKLRERRWAEGRERRKEPEAAPADDQFQQLRQAVEAMDKLDQAGRNYVIDRFSQQERRRP